MGQRQTCTGMAQRNNSLFHSIRALQKLALMPENDVLNGSGHKLQLQLAMKRQNPLLIFEKPLCKIHQVQSQSPSSILTESCDLSSHDTHSDLVSTGDLESMKLAHASLLYSSGQRSAMDCETAYIETCLLQFCHNHGGGFQSTGAIPWIESCTSSGNIIINNLATSLSKLLMLWNSCLSASEIIIWADAKVLMSTVLQRRRDSMCHLQP